MLTVFKGRLTLTRVTTPTELLASAVKHDPARPRLTWYDGASGERVELSGATLVNWVNKTAHLLINELGAMPGVSVSIDLPRHWLTAVWWLAVDAVGAIPVLGAAPAALVAVIGPDQLQSVPANDEVVAVSLLPLGAPFQQPLPPLVRDYAADVRGQGDQFAPAVRGDIGAGARAQELAAAGGLTATDRMLAVGPFKGPDDLAQGLLAPLAADASVIWVRNRPGSQCVEQLAAERVTVGVGERPPGAFRALGIRWLPDQSVSC